MNNQIVEISEENLENVVGGNEYGFFKKLGLGLVKPLGFYGSTPEAERTIGPWSYKDFGDFYLANKNGGSSQNEFSKVSALGTAVTTTVTVSGLIAAGMAAGSTVIYFVKDKVNSLLSK